MTSGAVIAIAMTLNELCTNAIKFGALSVPEGRVDLAWTVDRLRQRLRLVWTETNGPIVKPPARRSFGTSLIETLGRQLGGDVQLSYAPSGFSYSFDVPIAALSAPAG
jgi:two-component sensor histidine kinase